MDMFNHSRQSRPSARGLLITLLMAGLYTFSYGQEVDVEPKDKLTLQALMNVYGLLEEEKNFNRIVQQMEALKDHQ